MKAICDFCAHQESNPRGGVRCGRASYSHNDGYGPFKGGAACVHDEDLFDLFEPRTGAEISVRNLAATFDHQRDELMRARDEINQLKARLTRVEGR
jgi:hypothetical protein